LVHRSLSYYDPEMAAEEPSRVSWDIEPQQPLLETGEPPASF
jgi:hypothetical protein